MLRSCDYVVANSDGLRRELEASLDARLDNAEVVHNGTDAAKNLVAASSHDPAVGDFPQPYILSIGTFIKDKGHDLLIKAFNQISAPGSADFHLILIGRDDDFRLDCVELARNLGIEHRVRFLVNLPHPVCMAWVRHAEFFVLPSRFETFSLVLLEAAGFGKAVIATDVCGVRELVIDDSLGIVIPRDDTVALAEAMQTLIRNKGQRDKLGKKLQAFVTQQFTWSRAVQEYLDLAAGNRSQ
jgi:glycosyltransferase involved in cell wall biosynthesis